MDDGAAAAEDVPTEVVINLNFLHNLDGTSCFFNSLMVALFFPDTHGMVDKALFFEGEDVPHVPNVLKQTADVVRGNATCRNHQILRHAMCSVPALVRFRVGQQDPNEFLLHLMSACGGGDALNPFFFETRMDVVNTYAAEKKPTLETSTEKQRCESLGAITTHTNLARVFPRVTDAFEPGPDGVLKPVNADGLMQQRTLVQYLRGDVLIFTCERTPKAGGAEIVYGERDPVTRAYHIDVQSYPGDMVRFQLCSVIVWRGVSGRCGSGGGGYDCAMGHYTAYAYHAPSRQWVWYDDASGNSAQIMPEHETPETWPPTKRFMYGHVTEDQSKHVCLDTKTHTHTMFESPEHAQAHVALHGNEIISKWRPSTHGVFFMFIRVK